MNSLSCRSLTAGYGRLVVCRSIDLHVAAGEFLALLGPNGAGKSTLLRGLAGLSQKSGEVVLGERSLTGLSAARRARAGLAFVPESRGNVFASMTVAENMAIAARRTPQRRRAGRRELTSSLFPVLDRYAAKPAGLLSGGEQQMLAISMALLADPAAILLDEPSQGLAPSVLRAIGEALTQLRSTGITILLAEQNTRFATALADRVVRIEQGHLTDRPAEHPQPGTAVAEAGR